MAVSLLCGGGGRLRPAAAQTPPEPQDGEGFRFRAATNLVKVPISVFDGRGLLVGDLRKEDFRLWEDKERQDIRSVGVDAGAMSVVLVLDTSPSSKSEWKKIKSAAEDFAKKLGREDQISLITFDDEVNLVLDWTGDRKKVDKALDKIRPGYRTALYDAMYLAASEQLRGVEGQRAIILLTDCLNNWSRVGFGEAARAVAKSQASFYVVSKTAIIKEDARQNRRVAIITDIYRRLFGEDWDGYVDEFFAQREAEMAALAEETGGRVFFPADYDAIRDVYREIAQELKNKYYLTYVSNQSLEPDSEHRIAVEYLRPASGLRYRRSYYYRPQTPRRALAPAFASPK
jgi:VWFA-related protein